VVSEEPPITQSLPEATHANASRNAIKRLKLT
jgi:hypothetical protein